MRKFFSAFLILLLAGYSFGQKKLTLEEAITIALNNNSGLKKTEHDLNTFKADVKASYGDLLPSLGASGSWNWNRDETAGGIYTYNVAGFSIVDTVPSSTTESRRYNVGVGGDVTLFDGLSNYANLSRSKNNLESAEYNLQRLKEEIVFQTIRLYYDIVNTQQLLKVKEEDIKWNQKNLETITERNKLGAVTLADVYAQQVRAGNAELEVIRTKNNLETAKNNLLYYLGLDVLTEYNFSDSLSITEQSVLDDRLSKDYGNITQLVDQALNNRTDYKSAKLNILSAQNSITSAWGGHLPRLTGSYGFGSTANNVDELFDNKSYSAGLTLSIPIFSGFAIERNVEYAEVNLKKSEIDLSDLERNIKKDLQKTFLDLQAAEKALEVSRRNVTAAEETRKIEEEKYNLGSGTLLNVLIASSEYTNAQTNYINAQFAYIVLSQQLKYYLGILDYKKFE